MFRAWEDSDRRLLIGRGAGLLIVVGSLLTIPAVLAGGGHISRGLVISVGAALSGVLVAVLPWRRIDERWIHLVAVLVNAEIALGVAVAEPNVGMGAQWLYVLLIVFVACAVRSRSKITLHVALTSAAFCSPLLWDDRDVVTLSQAVIVVPMLVLVAVVAAALREGLEEGQRQLAAQARRDPLTGVGNRRHLEERLVYELARHRRAERRLAVLMLDIDGFKAVNDSLGHRAGDVVLENVARLLSNTVREQDTVTRPGGDEFVVVAPETDREEADALAARIMETLSTLMVDGRPLSASVGAAVFPADGDSATTLLASADTVQRAVKAAHYSAA